METMFTDPENNNCGTKTTPAEPGMTVTITEVFIDISWIKTILLTDHHCVTTLYYCSSRPCYHTKTTTSDRCPADKNGQSALGPR